MILGIILNNLDNGIKAQWSINYTGSSNAMELVSACRLWQCSEDQHGLRYTGLSDGDSKAYKAVYDLDIYHESTLKEKGINHVHIKMDTALINHGKQKNLGGKDYGRLTKEKTNKFQHYYCWAIGNNLQNIWALLFHCLSTDELPQHDRCPAGPNSWCFYQISTEIDRDILPYSTHIKHKLAIRVSQEMISIYERLFDAHLIKRMTRENAKF